MDSYYGVIYFKDGTKVETAFWDGPGAEEQCERQTQQEFEQYKATAIDPHFEPSRYEVKER